MGHSTYRLTADTYSHLWDDEDGSLAESLGASYLASAAAPPPTVRRIGSSCPEGLYVPAMEDATMQAIRNRNSDVVAWLASDGRIVSKFGEHMGWLLGVRLYNLRDQHAGWFGDGWFLDFRGGKTASLDAVWRDPASPAPPSKLKDAPPRPAAKSSPTASAPGVGGWSEQLIAALLR